MGKRRGRGGGSLLQRKDGRWMAVLNVGRDERGRRRRLMFYGKTEAEVQKKLIDALHEQQTGTLVLPQRMSVAEYLERWLKDYAAAAVRPRTFINYTQLTRKHLVPTIGRFQLTKLQPLHVQRLYSQKLAEGLSARSVRYLHAIVHGALARAVKWGLVSRNVADAVDPPRWQRKQMQVLTPAEAGRFLLMATGDRLYALYVLAITTGMRQGELLGLRWQDVDLERGALSVKQALQRVRGKAVFDAPKTERSRRSIALPALAIAALRKHKAQQAKERLLLGPDYADRDLVFCQADGTPLDRANLVNRSFRPLLRKAGLPDIRFHDLRHTCATLLLSQGVHPKVVSERLGHSTVTMTLDTYSHVLPDMQKEAAEKLDALLCGDAPAREPRRA